MRLLIVVLSLLLCWHSLAAQTAFAAKKITGSQIPPAIKFRGKVNEAWKWNDKPGENLLITSRADKYKDKASIPESYEDFFPLNCMPFILLKRILFINFCGNSATLKRFALLI